MINQFHAHGLEIILDVVYNHTAEGNELGPTLSFKGIDNASFCGCCRSSAAIRSTTPAPETRSISRIHACCKWWRIPALLGDRNAGRRLSLRSRHHLREPYGFDEGGGFLDACRQDPVLSGVKLIAEPWDIGRAATRWAGFHLGWGGMERQVSRYGSKLLERRRRPVAGLGRNAFRGSGDLFNKRGRRPWASINFVTAHDGFNLNDLVSYNDKHNEANGEDNRDGHSNNHSWNPPVSEGPADDPAILEAARAAKAKPAGHRVAAPTAADAAGGRRVWPYAKRQQQCVCAGQRDINWPNWLGISARGRALREFTRRLDRHRARRCPILYRSRFLVGSRNEELYVTDVTWLTPAATEMTTEQLAATRQRPLLRHAARRTREESGIKPARLGRDVADRLQRPSRCRPVHTARGGRRPALGRPDRHRQPEAPPGHSSLRSRLRPHRPIALRVRAGGRDHRRSAAGRRVDFRCDSACWSSSSTKPRRPCCPNSAAGCLRVRRAAASSP